MESFNDIASLKALVGSLLNRVAELESSYSELECSYSELAASYDVLAARNALLERENADLRHRLNLNSKNSHKPPSSDGLTKSPALPKAKGGRSGGQVGHKGTSLTMVAKPHDTVVHCAPCCSCCSRVFTASDVVVPTAHRRQVFDIPPPRLEVIEHQLGVIRCCGQDHIGTFPAGVTAPVQYGSQIKALSVMLNTDYKMPFDRIEQLFSDIYNCRFNESTAIAANRACFDALEATEIQIKAKILDSQVAHFDETGMRVEGKLHWFHTACTVLFTYLFVHANRGKKALESEVSLLKDFKNWAIHDCWKSYFDFTNCRHALCNAHIIRELDNLIQLQSLWAAEMKQCLFELYKLSEKGAKIVPNKQEWVEKYQAICQKADEEEPKPIKNNKGRPKSSKGRNLLNRLTQHQEGILAFAFIQTIPFTNNQAERDIRCLKSKQKAASSFRTIQGAKNYARIQGFISSVRKHKMNVFEQIKNVFDKKTINFHTT